MSSTDETPQDPQPTTEVLPSPDGHDVTVDWADGEWSATADCGAPDCAWDGSGWVVSLRVLGGNHAAGTDGSR